MTPVVLLSNITVLGIFVRCLREPNRRRHKVCANACKLINTRRLQASHQNRMAKSTPDLVSPHHGVSVSKPLHKVHPFRNQKSHKSHRNDKARFVKLVCDTVAPISCILRRPATWHSGRRGPCVDDCSCSSLSVSL